MTATITPYRSQQRAGRDGFAQLVRAEWTKFRTVPGWWIGTLVAVLLIVLVGLLGPAGSQISCVGPNGQTCHRYQPPIGPGGSPVADSFYFVHQPVAGNGEITARVTSLTGLYSPNGTVDVDQNGTLTGMADGTQPWSKAGIIIKAGTGAGSPYAAMMVTGSNGVRMQYDYTHDVAGLPGTVSASAPRWLRLVRSGDTITGYDSADGANWNRVGTVTLAGLPATAQVGMFAASPDYTVTTSSFGGTSSSGGPSQATGRFDQVGLSGGWSPGSAGSGANWTGDVMPVQEGQAAGLGAQNPMRSGFQQDGGVFTVRGTGDIAPQLPGQGPAFRTVEGALVGLFAGLIAMIVIASTFITAEYRRGLIRTTLAANPRRGRVLTAKCVVAGSVAFVAGLVASVIAIPTVQALVNAKGSYVYAVPLLTEVRVVIGTAGILAVTAVLAVAAGTLLRRGAGAVTAVTVVIVLPYILAVASVLPSGAALWLTRLSPAAAFAVQQSVPAYRQVVGAYTPANGFFPLAPWAGFAVLCGYATVAVALAVLALRRRDA